MAGTHLARAHCNSSGIQTLWICSARVAPRRIRTAVTPLSRGEVTSDYEYELPEELIAQAPASPRDSSRLMVLHRSDGKIEHRSFRDISRYFGAGDTLVVNATSVFRARLLGTREGSEKRGNPPAATGAPAEIFLLKQLDAARFEAMVHPGGKLHEGRRVRIADDLVVVIEQVTDRRTRIVRLETGAGGDVWDAIERNGHVPLPPYINRSDREEDAGSYQTIFARERGSVAAPTAGLHFSEELLWQLRERDVRFAEIVLHVGAGTFKPVSAEDPSQHVMHEERYSIAEEAARIVNEAKARANAVCAVGTTALRTLESSAANGAVVAESAETRLFVRPPYEFRVVDRLITNFHLPRSTLLMLVAAFAGYDFVKEAYAVAVKERYRFYSYGDAMLVL